MKVVSGNNVFATSVFFNFTFSGLYTHFNSYMLVKHKFSLVSAVHFCSFSSDMPKFYQGICKIYFDNNSRENCVIMY